MLSPMDTQCDIHKTEHIPLVVINFASDEIYLSKGETMGLMQIQSLDISEIRLRPLLNLTYHN